MMCRPLLRALRAAHARALCASCAAKDACAAAHKPKAAPPKAVWPGGAARAAGQEKRRGTRAVRGPARKAAFHQEAADAGAEAGALCPLAEEAPPVLCGTALRRIHGGAVGADGDAVHRHGLGGHAVFIAGHGGNGVQHVHAGNHLAEHGVLPVQVGRAARALVGVCHLFAHARLFQRAGVRAGDAVLRALHKIELAEVARAALAAVGRGQRAGIVVQRVGNLIRKGALAPGGGAFAGVSRAKARLHAKTLHNAGDGHLIVIAGIGKAR